MSRNVPITRCSVLLLSLTSVSYTHLNVAVIAVYFILSALGGLSPDEFEIFGKSLPLIFLIAGNLIFLLYDYALTCLAATYARRLQPKLHRLFHI